MPSPVKAHTLVPKLRFPEFREAGEWEEKRLDDFATIVRGGSPRPIDEYITNDASGLNWLKIGDIDKESKFVTSTQEKVIPAALNKTRVVAPGDLILSNSMSFGRPYILGIQTCIHDGWIAISEIKNSLDRDYLYYLMMTSACQTYFSNNAAGSGVQNLNADIIKLLPVSYPNKNEQQKIADCLASLDELITLEAQKLATLKTHKKGLMQQLFPAVGETLPNLRFPEFLDAGEWEEVALGEITKFSSGGTPSKDVAEYWGGSIPWISASSMYETNINKSELNVPALAIGNGTRISKKGSLLILVRGSMLFNRVPIGIATIDVAFNQDVKSLEIDDGISGTFLLYQLISFESRISINETGIGAGKIETDDLKRLMVFVPSVTEQQKIADCLTSLDDLITAQTQKLAALKTHKKGLMQQLFPALDEAPA